MLDAHFHMTQDLFEPFKTHHMTGIANAENMEELNKLQLLQKDYPFHISCGIHPWHASIQAYNEYLPYLKQAEIIGEIGLDNTWCDIDIDIQKEVFELQLQLAYQYKKPVILHLKGMEKEALPYLKKYPNTYLVHWYSCFEYLEEYIDLGCFFTIGPSIGLDETVTNVACKAPLNRILTESDGINALAWAYNCDEKDVDYYASLKRSIHKIATLLDKEDEDIQIQIEKNFQSFLKMNQ